MLAESQEPQSPSQIREKQTQLQRLLEHPLFKQSKRYPALLRYVVEQSLLGKAALLKERNIGIAVFGRDPDYDVSVDPVVRVTAAEVRRRLAQYYFDTAHSGELRIELPAGSYLPTFVQAPPAPALPAIEEIPPANSLVELESLPEPLHPTKEAKRRSWQFAALGFLLGGLAGFALHLPTQPSATERFWEPVLRARLPITMCIGAPKETSGFAEQIENVRSSSMALEGKSPGAQSISDHYRTTGLLQASDVTALTRIATAFATRPYHLMDASDTDYSRLQEGPTVLVGGIDNAWTMRLTQALPYRLSWDSSTRVAQIVDSKAHGSSAWRLATDSPYRDLSTDYAVVARYRDATTGQFVVIVAGLGAEGTEAASELVSEPSYTALLIAHAPRDWQKLNFEAVISTKIIDGEAGPPSVVASRFW